MSSTAGVVTKLQRVEYESNETVDGNDHARCRRFIGDLQLVAAVSVEVVRAECSARPLASPILLQPGEDVPVERAPYRAAVAEVEDDLPTSAAAAASRRDDGDICAVIAVEVAAYP